MPALRNATLGPPPATVRGADRRYRPRAPIGRPSAAGGLMTAPYDPTQTRRNTMPKGPIPLRIHAALEPLVALVLIAAPWIFGFDDVGSATAVSIAVGVLMLISGMSTRWRYSVVKLIPLRTHFRMDLVLGVVLIVAPFVFGDSDRGDATRFLVIMGILELATALGTRWDLREEVAPQTSRGGRGATAAR